jgi:transforming growth factor-beta-induced protein
VPATLNAEAVVELDGALVGTALNETALSISVSDDGVMVNDANVVAVDVEAANGVIHVIDSVLLPPADDNMMGMMAERMESSLAEIAVASTEAETPEFTILVAAVLAADPAILSELSAGGPFTVFAPTDAAFAAALEALGVSAEDLLADTETLTQILLYHVVPGELGASTVVAVAAGGVEVATVLPGTTVTVTASDAGVTVNDANVIQTDIFGTNGVIHVIDAVLLPPADDDM